jgi:hypothetical protein
MIELRRRLLRDELLLDIWFPSGMPESLFNLHAYSKVQLALASSRKWILLHQAIPKN